MTLVKKISSAVSAFAILGMISVPAGFAESAPTDDSAIVSKLSGSTKDGSFCGKGDATSALGGLFGGSSSSKSVKITVRSFDGAFANSLGIAAFAISYCWNKNQDKFQDSSFVKNAISHWAKDRRIVEAGGVITVTDDVKVAGGKAITAALLKDEKVRAAIAKFEIPRSSKHIQGFVCPLLAELPGGAMICSAGLTIAGNVEAGAAGKAGTAAKPAAAAAH